MFETQPHWCSGWWPSPATAVERISRLRQLSEWLHFVRSIITRGATGSLDRCYRLVWGVRLSAVAKGAICDECYIYAGATCASGFHSCVSSSFRLLSSRSTTCWLWYEDIFCHQCYHKVIPILLEFRPLCVVARDADMAIVMNRQAWENVRKCEKWSRTIGVNPDHDNVTRRTTFWQLNIYCLNV